ncbi:hypothetical protein SAMN02745166_01502 [Prosthecobacter debontii]|uniref:Uncharacterized protein n=1 Tax=Prosthecobacter debontii TaxID=48467 RepID=A0A1T4XHD8_9BACT|nr:hypothetical protein [Prosthecobacter debontii]SKA88883.1 hypothetical protein SAMN02745166_01502 [Prosthecobacter debontii]
MASLVVSAIVAVVGAAVSAYGSYQSGKTQAAIANANAKEQERQAANNLNVLNAQSQMQAAEADVNFKLRQSEANARKRNAEQLEQQNLQQDAINRANLDKRRQEFAAMQAEQRVALADSGVLEASGTPLDLLAETATKIQQDRDEQHLANEQKRRTLFSEADMERLGGELALQGATMDRNLGLTQAALTAFTGQAEYNSGMRRAEITRLTGRAAKQAANYQAASTLISSLGSTGMTVASS